MSAVCTCGCDHNTAVAAHGGRDHNTVVAAHGGRDHNSKGLMEAAGTKEEYNLLTVIQKLKRIKNYSWIV